MGLCMAHVRVNLFSLVFIFSENMSIWLKMGSLYGKNVYLLVVYFFDIISFL